MAVVAPASLPFHAASLQPALDRLSELGLAVKKGRHLFHSWGEFAGRDRERLEDLHLAFADKEVKAIFVARGGNGCARLLPMLDFDLIKDNPKIIVGFSDITALLIPVFQICGLVTFHGPTLGTLLRSGYTYAFCQRALMDREPLGLIEDPELESPWSPPYPARTFAIAPGRARGQLSGGCMTVIRQLMGSRYEIETEGKIVFLEDVSEEPHSLERMLAQLLLAGKLQRAAGIIIGECVSCNPGDSKRNVLPLNSSFEQIARERLSDLGIPVAFGMRIGHGWQQVTLPLGVMASLQVAGETVRLEIEESATSD